jgi:ankyrin repeat protein
MNRGAWWLLLICIACISTLGCSKPKPAPSAQEIDQFIRASYNGDIATVDRLLATRSNRELLTGTGGDNRSTALHAASFTGHLDVVQRLIDKGADLSARNDAQSTPLHVAAAGGQKAVVDLLISSGAQVDARDNVGTTPLGYAAIRGHPDVAEALLAKGADPNARLTDGTTTLTLATKSGQSAVADVIRRHGGTQ